MFAENLMLLLSAHSIYALATTLDWQIAIRCAENVTAGYQFKRLCAPSKFGIELWAISSWPRLEGGLTIGGCTRQLEGCFSAERGIRRANGEWG
jgi:hypothetical protein